MRTLRPFSTAGLVWLLACVPLLGCENLEKRTKYLTGPEVFEWESDIRFHVQGEKDMWGQAMVNGEELSVFFRGFPPGTTLTVGTATATADDEGYADARTNVAALFGALPTEDVGKAESKLDGATFDVTPPGGDPIPVTLPAQTAYGVKDTLLSAASGPVLFSGETAEQGPIRNAIWWPSFIDQEVIGAPAPKVADIDAIVIVTRPEGKPKTCTGYTDDSGNPQPDVTITLKNTDVVIHERRTGREVAKKSFLPNDECPEWLTVEKGRKEVRDSAMPTDDVRAWIGTQVAG